MKSRRGLILSGVSFLLCAVLWTAAVGAQAGIYARSTKVLPHTGYTFVPNTPADWLVTSDTLQAGIGVGHPGHNSASLDLSQVNWSLNPAKQQNWSLNKAKRNEWGGWMDLNRPAVSGWLEGRYSCAYVLACDQADFTTSTARGYAIGFKAGGSSPLVLFRFDAGINSGALPLPANTTEIVQSGYNYLDADNGVNFHVQLQSDGHWAVRWKSGAALPTESVFDTTSYTAQVVSTGTDTTYQGYEFKYAGWVYAHSVSSLAYAYFDNPGAGESPYDFSAPTGGAVGAPTYAKTPFAVSWSGVTDALSGVASVEVWAKKDSQTAWTLAGANPSGSGLVAFSPANGDGTYGFTLVTVDRDGNRSAEPTSMTVPADTTVYDTVQPVAGPVTATQYSSTSLNVSYSGTTDTLSGLASVQLWYSYDNTNSWTAFSGMTASTPSASFTLDSLTPSFSLNEGVYYFGFVVTDNAGNTTSTASGRGAAVSYFDTTAPTAGSVMAPQYMTDGPIPVAFGGFLDGVSGLREVRLGYRLVGAPTWVYDAVYTTTTATGTFQFNPVLGNGTYEFQARALDNAGNMVVSGSTAQTIVDNESPMGGTMSVGVLSPVVPAHITNATPLLVTYSGTTDTLSGVKAVHLWYVMLSSGPGGGWLDSGLMTTTTAGSFSFTPPLDPYTGSSDGVYMFMLVVVDNAGNEGVIDRTYLNQPAFIVLDTVQPSAGEVTSPAYENGTSVTLSYADVTEEFTAVSTVTLYANSWSNPIYNRNFLGFGSVTVSDSFSYTPPSDGTYVFGLRVWDGAGNMSESVTSSTTVYDTTAPTTAGLAVATVTSGTVIPVTCTAYPQDLTSGVGRVELWYRVNGTTWTASSLTFATTGTVNFVPPSGINGVYEFGTVVTDRARNQTAIPPEAATTTTYDSQAPAVGAVTTPAYTNTSLISVAYSGFADAGLGLADVRLWVRVGSSGTWTASPTEFSTTPAGTFSYTATTDGPYYFAVVARDLLGNSTALPAVTGAMDSTVYDTVAPTVVSVTPSNAGPISSSVLDFNVVFSEPVQGFDPALQLVLGSQGTTTATAMTVTGSGNTYTVHVTGLTGDGSVRLQVLSAVPGGVTDLAGNLLAGGMTSGWVGNDSTPPTVLSINRKAPLSALTSAAQVTFEVKFSEPVRDVALGDFTVDGTYAQTSASLLSHSGSGDTWTVVVNTVEGTGDLSLDVVAGTTQLRDVAGNALAVSFTTGETYTVDREAPYVTAITRETPAEADTSATAVTFKVAFNEPIFTTLTASNFTLDATGAQDAAVVTTVTRMATSTYTSTDVPQTIPDVSQLASSLVVTDSLLLTDVNVFLNIQHTFDDDLQVYLVSPEGTTVTLTASRGDSGDNYTGTIFDDETTVSIAAGAAPFTGSFRPETPLSALDGENGKGTWKLIVQDAVLGDSGTLLDWGIVASGSFGSWMVSVETAPGKGDLGIALTNVAGIVDQVGLEMTQPFAGQGEVYHVDRENPTVTSIVRYNPVDSRTKEAEVQFLLTFNEPVTGLTLGNLSLNATDGQLAASLLDVVDGGGDSSTYTIRVATAAPAGRLGVDVDLNLNTIRDAFGNPMVTTFTQGQKYDVNRNAPMVSRAIPTSGTTVASLPEVTVVFDSQVAGVAAGDLTVNGSAATTLTALGYHMYRFEGFVEPANGPVEVVLAGGATQDLYGNAFAGGSWSYVKDSAALTVSLASTDVVNGGSSKFEAIYMTATFSAPVTGFNAATDITVTNGWVDNFIANSATEYEFFVHPTAVGEVTVQVGYGMGQTIALPTVLNAASTVFAFSHDNVPTTVESIERRTPATPLTNAATVVYRVVFSEAVRGPAKTNFTAVGTSGQATAAVAGVAAVDPTALGYSEMWDVTVNTVSNAAGTLKIDLINNLSRITDMAGNSMQIAAVFTGGELYTVDRVQPNVMDIEPYQPVSDASPTNAQQVVVRYVFDKPVRGVTPSMFTAGIGEPPQNASTIAGVTPVGGSPATQWLVTANTVDNAMGNLYIDLPYQLDAIVDTAGNSVYLGGSCWDSTHSAFWAPFFYTIDRVDPTVVSIVRNEASPTSSSLVSFTVTFNEDVTGVDSDSFSVDATGDEVAAPILSVTPVSASVYQVVGGTVAGKGSLSVDLSNTAGIADQVGNTMSAGFVNGEAYQIDRQGPSVVAIDRFVPAAAVTSATQVTFQVTFDEPVTSVTLANFSIDATSNQAALTSAALESVTNAGDGTTWTVTVDTAKGLGWLSVDLTTTTGILDFQGNELLTTFTAGAYYEINRVPFCTAIKRFDPADALTSASQVAFQVLFSDEVNNVTSSDFVVDATGGQAGAAIFGVSGAGTTWTVTVNTVDMAHGLVSVDFVTTAGVTDSLGNTVSGVFTAGEAYEVNRVAPQLVSVERYNPLDAATSASEVTFKATFSMPVVNVTDAAFEVSLDSTFDQIGAYVSAVTGSGTTWYVKVQTSSGIGDLAIDLVQPTAVTDAAGNPVADIAPSVNEMYSVSRLPEVLAIRRYTPLTPNTNAAQVVFEVAFNERVLYVDADNFSIDATDAEVAAAVNSVASDPSGANWMVTVDTVPGVGSLSVDLNRNLSDIEDVVGYPLTTAFAAGELYLVDREGTSVTVEQAEGQADPTSGSIVFDVKFSDPVVGFTTTSVQFMGTATVTTYTVTGADGDTTYTINVTGVSHDGTVVPVIPAGVVVDPAGNGNFVSTSTDNSVTYDSTPPSVTIEQAAGQADPTSVSAVRFDVRFSEPVWGFDASDVVTSGTAGGGSAAVIAGADGDTTYTVEITGFVSDGIVIASIAADAAHDAVGFPSLASTSVDNQVTLDTTLPNVTGIVPATTGPTNADSVAFTVTFSEPVTGFAQPTDVAVNKTGTVAATAVALAQVSPTTYTVTVSGITGDGSLALSVNPSSAQDHVGNYNVAAGPSAAVLIDNTRPEVATLTPATTGPTNADSVVFTVGFNEAVSGFTQPTDVQVSKTGSVVTTGVALAQVSPTTYTVTVSGVTGDGSLTLGVNESSAFDLAGNASLAGGPSAAVLIDNTAPTVAGIVPATTGPTNADSVAFTVDFSEAMTGFSQAGDVTVNHTGTASTGVAIAAVSTSQYTVTVSGITGDGSLSLSVNPSTAQDLAGNLNAAGGPSTLVAVDNTAPTVVAVAPAAGSVVESVTTVSVTLSEAVTGLQASDLKLNGNAAVAVSGSNPYIFSGFGAFNDGAVEAVLASAALDGAGNVLTSSTWTFTVQSPTPLTVALDSVDVTSGTYTKLAAVDFVTTFSEPVEGLTTASITVVNATIQSVVALTSRTYTFTAAPTADGLVTVQVPAGATTATLTGRLNAASDVFPFHLDTTPPVLSGAPTDQGAMTSNTALVFNWTPATDAGAGLATYEYQFSFDPTFAAVTTSGTLPFSLTTMTVTGADGQMGYFRVRATDALGNVSAFSTPSDGILVDVTAPYVGSFIPSTTGPTTATEVSFDYSFNEPVFGYGDPGDLTVNVTGTVTYTTVTITQVTPTTYTATVSGIAGVGTLTVQVNAGVCVDVVGNPNVASLPSPTVWIGGEIPAPVMVAEPTYTAGTQNTVAWSAVAGAVSYTVEAATNATFTSGVTSQTVTATQATFTGLSDGVEYFYRVFATTDGGVSTWSNGVSSTQDATAPTVILVAQTADPTSVAQVLVTATFSEGVTGFALDDLVTTNAVATTLTQVNASTWTFWATAQTSGSVAIQVLAGAGVDRAGNASLASAVATWTLDQTAPAVVMASASSDPTSLTVIPMQITFSEPVTGFAADDIVTSNATVANFTAGADGTTYTANLLVTLTDDGMVTADIAAGVAFDLAGNPNTTATQLVRHYMKSLTPPVVVISTTAGFATNVSPIPVTVTFDQDVTGFTVEDATVGNGLAGNFVAVSAKVYTFDVTPVAEGLVTVDVAANVAVNAKSVGNLAAAQLEVIYDITAPMVALTSSISDPTTATVIPVLVTFSEPVTGFTADDIVASNATVSDFVAGTDGTTYTANLDVTLTQDGVVTADIAGAVAADLAGNPNTTATQLVRQFVLTSAAPTLVLSTTAGFATHVSPIPVMATFDQAVTGFAADDVVVTNGSVINFASVSAKVYTFDVTPAAEGPVTVNVAADVAVNAFDKGNLAAAPLSVAYDITAPTVTLATQVDDPTTQAVVSVTATFSEPVSELTPAVVTVLGATVSNVVAVNTSTFTFDVTAQGSGDVAVQILAGAVQDAADNGNLPSNVLTWTVDIEGPVPVLSSPVSATSDTLIPARVAFSEPVVGFTAADLVTVAGVTVEHFAAVNASDTTFTFDLRVSLQADANLTVDVPAGVCVDGAGNPNAASNQLTIAYQYNQNNFPLPAPTGVTASDGAYTFKTQVSWNAVEGASFYKVYRTVETTTDTAQLEEVTGWISALAIDDQSAEPGVKYLYQVRAASTEQGGRQSELSTADLGWIATAPVSTTAWYKIQYTACTLDADSTPVSLDFTGTSDKSTVKILLLPKGKPANAVDVAGKVAYRELAKLDSVTVDGNLKSFYSNVDIETLEGTGPTSYLKSVTTKNANIAFINAAQVGTVKLDVAKDSTGAFPEYPSTSIYTTGDVAAGAKPAVAKVQLTGTILADLDMEQALSYVKAATKKHTVKINGVRQYRVSLGGIGPVLRVVNEVMGQQPAEPFPMGSSVRATKIGSISVSGGSIVPDMIDSMVQKVTASSGLFKVTNTGGLPTPKASYVVVVGNIRVAQLVSGDVLKLLQATPKTVNKVPYGGLIGTAGTAGYPLMMVLAPNIGTVYGKGGLVSGIFIAGYNVAQTEDGPVYMPNYTGSIKKIFSSKTGQLWGEAYLNPAQVAKLLFLPKDHPNFVVNPTE